MKKGWIFLLALLCVAFLVSCGKKSGTEGQEGELVRLEKQLQDRTGATDYEKTNPLSAGL